MERSFCLSAGVWVCREPYGEHHPCQGLHGQGVHFGNQALAASQGGDAIYAEQANSQPNLMFPREGFPPAVDQIVA